MSRRYLAYTNDNDSALSKVARTLNNIPDMGDRTEPDFDGWPMALQATIQK
jgi:hypothetical protein